MEVKNCQKSQVLIGKMHQMIEHYIIKANLFVEALFLIFRVCYLEEELKNHVSQTLVQGLHGYTISIS